MITSCVVSRSLPFFVEGFHKRLGCGYKYEPLKAAFFVGMYNEFEFNRLLRHKGLAVVIFCGSDAFLLDKRPWFGKMARLDFVRGIIRGKVRVVSISEDISNALKSLGIESSLYNVCPTDLERFKVTKPQGKRVYVYYNDAHEKLFDWRVYEDVVNHYRDSDIVIDKVREKRFVNPLDMPKEYEGCFVGMKPYIKDGYGNTQVELALSGRRCISNGAFVGNLRYANSVDVISHIDKELKNVNDLQGRDELRNLAVKELELPTGFNEIDFWL